MPTATEALASLKEGNRRYVAGTHGDHGRTGASHRDEVAGGQQPFATVLGCADSRVPVEVVFDQGLGDLFVVRVAGNIAAPTQVGSIEYAVSVLGTPLVVVLGHSGCGAIGATLDLIAHPERSVSPDLDAIVSRIRPAIESLASTEPAADRATLQQRAMRANVRATVDRLRHDSAALRARVEDGSLAIVGAEYALDSGVVEFLDTLP